MSTFGQESHPQPANTNVRDRPPILKTRDGPERQTGCGAPDSPVRFGVKGRCLGAFAFRTVPFNALVNDIDYGVFWKD